MKKWIWPGIPIVLLFGCVVFHISMLVYLVKDPEFAYEPDYYKKAIHWDATIAQEKQNRRLGWSLEWASTPRAVQEKQASVCVKLVDAQKSPLSGAKLRMVAFHNARSMQRQRVRFQASGNGKYCSPIWLKRAGIWEFRFLAEREGKRWTMVQQMFLRLGSSAG